MRISRVAPALSLLLAWTAWGADNAMLDEWRVHPPDFVRVGCHNGQSTSLLSLDIDARAHIRLPTGKLVRIHGLAATEILERWRGTLCPKEGMATTVELAMRVKDGMYLLLADPFVDREFESYIEIQPVPSRNSAIERISNGSLVILPPLPD